MEIVKKLSLAKIGISRGSLFIRGNDSVIVANFLGFVSGVEKAYSDMGDYLCFRGEFKGMNRITGQEAVSPFLILPKSIEVALKEAYEKCDAKMMEFAITVRAEHSDKFAGFKYALGEQPYFNGLETPV